MVSPFFGWRRYDLFSLVPKWLNWTSNGPAGFAAAPPPAAAAPLPDPEPAPGVAPAPAPLPAPAPPPAPAPAPAPPPAGACAATTGMTRQSEISRTVRTNPNRAMETLPMFQSGQLSNLLAIQA